MVKKGILTISSLAILAGILLPWASQPSYGRAVNGIEFINAIIDSRVFHINPWLIVPVNLPILALLVALIAWGKPNAKNILIVVKLAAIALGATYAYFMSASMQRDSAQIGMGFVLIVLGLIGYVIDFAVMEDPGSVASEMESTDKPSQALETGRNIGVKLSHAFEGVKTFVGRYKLPIALITGLLIVGYGIYLLFVKPDPESDAALAGKGYCECSQTLSDDLNNAGKEFLSSFESAHYATRNEARAKYEELQNAQDKKFYDCNRVAAEQHFKLQSRYSDKPEELQLFESQVTELRGACVMKDNNPAALLASIEDKIATIYEAEPDEQAIKEKLIGHSLPGWKFSSLSEIQSLVIKKKQKGKDRIEVVADIKVANSDGAKIFSYTDALLILSPADGVWMVESISARSFVWSMTVGNTWTPVKLPVNCTYKVNTSGRKGWIKSDGFMAHSFKIGPDGEPLSLHSSTVYIASRETEPVTITFDVQQN